MSESMFSKKKNNSLWSSSKSLQRKGLFDRQPFAPHKDVPDDQLPDLQTRWERAKTPNYVFQYLNPQPAPTPTLDTGNIQPQEDREEDQIQTLPLEHVQLQEASGEKPSEDLQALPLADIQRLPAIVPVIVWFGKALAATTIDALIDFAIAAILGLPTPGLIDNLGNLVVNLVPLLGELKKGKKVAKLFKVIGNIVQIMHRFKQLKIPGAAKLFPKAVHEASLFKSAVISGSLKEAKESFGRLLGHLREAQVASSLAAKGEKLLHLGKEVKVGQRTLTDIDVITEESGQRIYTQVKAGKAASLGPGSNSWTKFTNQANHTIAEAAKDNAKVRYDVDDISPDAEAFLNGLGVEIRKTFDILK